MSIASRYDNRHGGYAQSTIMKATSPLYLAFLYGCCSIVTFIYVHFYVLYSYLREVFGPGFITWAPIATSVVVLPLLICFFVCRQKNNPAQVSWSFVFWGMMLAVVALFIPEPTLGAKRIHVTEYVLLSLLVRYTLSQRHTGNYLFSLSILFTVLLGIHDEFLQGLHPQRTYGLRDIAVNTVSAVAGGCIWHGLGLFFNKSSVIEYDNNDLLWPVLYLFWLSFAVVLTITPIPFLKHSLLPLWIFLPLAASMVYCSLFLPRFSKVFRHGIWAMSGAAFLLFIYPVMTNVFQITFY